MQYRMMMAVMAMSGAAAGCSGFGDGETEVLAGEVHEQIQALAAENEVRARGGIRTIDRPWYGETPRGNPIRVSRGQKLPQRVENPGIEVVVDEPVSYEEATGVIAASANIRILWVKSPVEGNSDGPDTDSRDQPPPEFVRLDHNGPMSLLLEDLSRIWDVAWDYDGRVIRFFRNERRHYSIPIAQVPPSIDDSAALFSVPSVDVDPWTEVATALANIRGADIQIQKGLGQIVVTAPPSVQRIASREIERLRRLYSQRIAVEVSLWFLDADELDEAGLGISALFNDGEISISLGSGVAGPQATGGIQIVDDSSAWANSQAFFRLANEAGAVIDRRQSSTITTNGVLSPVAINTSRNYVRGWSRSIDQGVVVEEVEIDQIAQGISLFVVPRVLEGERIHLSVWLSYTSLLQLREFNTAQARLQLPETDVRSLAYAVILPAGSRLLMGGYEQQIVRSRSTGSGSPEFWLFGGSRNASTQRGQMVVAIRPVLLGDGR